MQSGAAGDGRAADLKVAHLSLHGSLGHACAGGLPLQCHRARSLRPNLAIVRLLSQGCTGAGGRRAALACPAPAGELAGGFHGWCCCLRGHRGHPTEITTARVQCLLDLRPAQTTPALPLPHPRRLHSCRPPRHLPLLRRLLPTRCGRLSRSSVTRCTRPAPWRWRWRHWPALALPPQAPPSGGQRERLTRTAWVFQHSWIRTEASCRGCGTLQLSLTLCRVCLLSHHLPSPFSFLLASLPPAQLHDDQVWPGIHLRLPNRVVRLPPGLARLPVLASGGRGEASRMQMLQRSCNAILSSPSPALSLPLQGRDPRAALPTHVCHQRHLRPDRRGRHGAGRWRLPARICRAGGQAGRHKPALPCIIAFVAPACRRMAYICAPSWCMLSTCAFTAIHMCAGPGVRRAAGVRRQHWRRVHHHAGGLLLGVGAGFQRENHCVSLSLGAMPACKHTLFPTNSITLPPEQHPPIPAICTAADPPRSACWTCSSAPPTPQSTTACTPCLPLRCWPPTLLATLRVSAGD